MLNDPSAGAVPRQVANLYAFPKDLLTNQETNHYILFEIYDKETASVNTTKRSVVRTNDDAAQWSRQVRNERQYGDATRLYSQEDVQALIPADGRLNGVIGEFRESTVSESVGSFQRIFSKNRLSLASDKSADSIVLPLPQNLQMTDGWNWETVGFQKTIFGEVASSVIEGENILDATAKAFRKLQTRLAAPAIENADRIFEAQSRVAFNPRKEMLFNEPDARVISFEYEFAPKNESESKAISDVLNLFKYYSSPERKELGSSLYRYPAEYQIYFISNEQENPFIAKLSRVVLTNIQTDYNGTGVLSMLKNSSPSKIKVTMTFNETELLDRRHYYANDETSGVTPEITGGE